MNRRGRRLGALLPLVIALGLGVAGCGGAKTAAAPVPPAQIRPVPGTALHSVTLSPQAMADVGVRTQAVRSVATGASRPLLAIPLGALIYDPQGRSWTYVTTAPRTFVRRAVVIERIEGDEVLLRAGPAAGSLVVTVGAPELLGAEYGVGEE